MMGRKIILAVGSIALGFVGASGAWAQNKGQTQKAEKKAVMDAYNAEAAAGTVDGSAKAGFEFEPITDIDLIEPVKTESGVTYEVTYTKTKINPSGKTVTSTETKIYSVPTGE